MNKEEKRSQLEELGVSFAKPKYPSYSILLTRISTFTEWTCSQSKEEMAKAGFFYTGYSDNVRCFFCGNGLGNWETEDDPWVEHAHWFPKCVFLEFCKGKSFIMEVQQVVAQQNNLPPQINTDTVENHRDTDNRIVCAPSSTDDTIQSMAAVYVIQMGYPEPLVKRAVHHWTLRSGSSKYSTTDLVEIIKDMETNDLNVSESNTNSDGSNERTQLSTLSNSNSTENSNRSDYDNRTTSDIETDKALSDDDMDIDSQQCDLELLKNENEQLRDTVTCKVCMEEKVSVIFLPCAHMVTCSQCSPAMKNCPFCRTNIKGIVRAYLV